MQRHTFTRAFKFTAFLALMLFIVLLTSTLYAAPKVGPVTPENSIIGQNAGDYVGGGVYKLLSGNIVITSGWMDGRGAVTCLTPEEYQTGGIVVSASNSLVGSTSDDGVGTRILVLANGHYVVTSMVWDNGSAVDAGAITWVNGNTCIPYGESSRGAVVSPNNSLVGTNEEDRLGWSLVTPLPNGNYVVRSPSWDNDTVVDAGAVTWGNGEGGTVGPVSEANSLVGSSTGDEVGLGDITVLSNGNYVVSSYGWNNGAATNAGAVTWGNGLSGITGAISPENSLIGSTTYDAIGYRGVTALTNGNYVVTSAGWDNGTKIDAGAVTWANGEGGTVGLISEANSLVGNASDDVGNGGVTALTNGNYVVRSYYWNNGSVIRAGAVTWGNGLGGTVGLVSPSNSLVGSAKDDRIGYVGISASYNGVTALTNGNYVVASSWWSNGAQTIIGAVTWGNGAGGTVGLVSPSNSLIGSTSNDQVGDGGVKALTNGNYVVSSSLWDNAGTVNAGAATWGDGNGGTVGVVNPTNSLVGSSANDQVGYYVTALNNGHYVVSCSGWDNGGILNVGAITWGDGNGGTVGVVSAANSLVGSSANDQIGSGTVITTLANGNYVVVSRNWKNGTVKNAGAVTWGNGETGTVGVVSAANSLVGSTAEDQVGYGGIFELTNGNYVISSHLWDNGGIIDAGAATWANGEGGTVGVVSPSNSLVGSTIQDTIGVTDKPPRNKGITPLSNGSYIVRSPSWKHTGVVAVGAVTWADGEGGTIGLVRPANSLVGSAAYDSIGSGVTALDDGSYLIYSPNWDGAIGNSGVVVWLDSSPPPANSAPVLPDIENQTVYENATLTLNTEATDPDIFAQVLTYSITGAPEDATFDTATGGFSWTPDEADGGQTFNVTVTGTDDGEPALSDSEAFTITVNPVVVEETNYLPNASFENPGTTNKTAAGWNGVGLTKNDKRICDTETKTYALDGECAFRFQFNGASKPTRALQRKLNAADFAKNDAVELRGMVKANGLTAGARLVLKVVYNNDKAEAVNVKLSPGSYDYAPFTVQMTLKRPVKKITAQIRAGSAKGTFFVDDMAVVKVAAPLTIEDIPPASGLRGLR